MEGGEKASERKQELSGRSLLDRRVVDRDEVRGEDALELLGWEAA